MAPVRATSRPVRQKADFRWADKVVSSVTWCIAGAVVGVGLYFGNTAYIRATNSSATTPPTPPAPTGQAAAMLHSKVVPADTWIDFDVSNNPTYGNARPGVPATADIQVGPDDIFAPRAWLWVPNATASCATQTPPGHAFEADISLAELLPPRTKSVLYVCMLTSQRRAGLLAISSVNGDGLAPYLIKYTLYGTIAS